MPGSFRSEIVNIYLRTINSSWIGFGWPCTKNHIYIYISLTSESDHSSGALRHSEVEEVLKSARSLHSYRRLCAQWALQMRHLAVNGLIRRCWSSTSLEKQAIRAWACIQGERRERERESAKATNRPKPQHDASTTTMRCSLSGICWPGIAGC